MKRIQRRLGFERLESKTMLAANAVTASVVSDKLILEGDDLSNAFSVIGSANGEYTVVGRKADGSITQIRPSTGANPVEVKPNQYRFFGIEALVILGRDGDDRVSVRGAIPGKGTSINLGDGIDRLMLPSNKFNTLNVSTGDDKDFVKIKDTVVLDRTFVNTGNGSDSVGIVGNSILTGEVTLNEGEGADRVAIRGAKFLDDVHINTAPTSHLVAPDARDVVFAEFAEVEGNLSVLTGLGDDEIKLHNLTETDLAGNGDETLNSALTINSGPGDDIVEIEDLKFGSLDLQTRDGKDEVTVASAELARFVMNTGDERDEVEINSATTTSVSSVHLEKGEDVISIRNSDFGDTLYVDCGGEATEIEDSNNTVRGAFDEIQFIHCE